MKIVVLPYQKKWPDDFEQEKRRLQEILPVDLLHIGSTSIPGCAAKPIIDILGVTNETPALDAYNKAMTVLGYEALGEYGMKRRRFFRKRQGLFVNLHLFEESDPEVERHLRFADYLRRHPEKRDAYSQLKREAATKHPTEIERYIEEKAAFIKACDMQGAREATQFLYPKKNLSKKKKWSLSEIEEAMHANWHLQMLYFSKYIPSLEHVVQPDCSVVRSPIPCDSFNTVFSADFPPEKREQRIAQVASLFGNTPFSWWAKPQLHESLLKYGLRLNASDTGMYIILQDTYNQDDKIEKVENLDQFKAFGDLMTSTGESPLLYEALYSLIPPILIKEGFEFYLGYEGTQAAVAGVLVLHAHVAGIYYIAVPPHLRRKGHATKMMCHLLAIAYERGYHLATLFSTPMGLPLYEKMGFERCSSLEEYSVANI